jgi:hypothetical protein
MYPELEAIIHQAEDKYLTDEDLQGFSSHISSLKERLEIYELIRDNEIMVFQNIANELLEKFPNETKTNIEKCLKHWLLTMRYCNMAMLLNNTDFLEHRLLEWMTDIVNVYELETLEYNTFNLLLKELKKIVSETQFTYILPLLEQAKNTVLTTEVLT